MYEGYIFVVLIILLIRFVTLQFPDALEKMRNLAEFQISKTQQKEYDLLKYILGRDESLVYITGWSILHFVSGIIIGIIVLIKQYGTGKLTFNNYVVENLIIHSLWELYQLSIEATPYWTKRGWVDIGTDTVLYMMGALLPFISTNHTV